jgi:hypothetical protein
VALSAHKGGKATAGPRQIHMGPTVGIREAAHESKSYIVCDAWDLSPWYFHFIISNTYTAGGRPHCTSSREEVNLLGKLEETMLCPSPRACSHWEARKLPPLRMVSTLPSTHHTIVWMLNVS